LANATINLTNDTFECPICGKRTIAGITSKVVLDHDHETGEARAWICDSCNTGIGRFKDDVALLQRAIKFLG
jgi:transcription elongation factor Elf1